MKRHLAGFYYHHHSPPLRALFRKREMQMEILQLDDEDRTFPAIQKALIRPREVWINIYLQDIFERISTKKIINAAEPRRHSKRVPHEFNQRPSLVSQLNCPSPPVGCTSEVPFYLEQIFATKENTSGDREG